MTIAEPVLAAHRWKTNAHLIEDVARLGYLRLDDLTLDPTYGKGVWWKRFRPKKLIAHDLKLDGVDFLHLPHDSGMFDVVAFDPPYKLNGTPDPQTDERYGVDVVTSWQGRHQLIREGMDECARMLRPGGVFLLKCQDQVCGGKIRWQTDEFTTHAGTLALVKVEEFSFMGGGRAQPGDRGQQHAYFRPSTLIVFKKSKSTNGYPEAPSG